jgi:hypothetical protein
MSKVVSLRLKEDDMGRLTRLARRLGRTPSETAAVLVGEKLRQAEFGFIDFRDSPVGRQAYVQGSSLAVWEVVMVARNYRLDPDKTSAHLDWPRFKVEAAFNYFSAFPDEIELAIADNDHYTTDYVARLLPQASSFEASGKARKRA